MEEQERIVKGICIPIEIWKDKNLSWNEKILFLEIDSYTSQDKDCYFSNEYIAELLGVSITHASKLISSLIEKGLVIKTKFDGRKRFIKTALSFTTSQTCHLEQPCYNKNIIITNSINNKDYLEEKEDILSSKKKNQRFVKPTIDDINAYIQEQGMHFNAESFFDYYESKGWVVGKSPMKDWKAACRTWESNRKKNTSYMSNTKQKDLFNSDAETLDSQMVINGQIYR